MGRDSSQVDVELSAPAVNETLESWQVSTRDAGTLLRGGSMCKVAGSINSTGCDSVSHFQNLHFIQLLCENSCSLHKKAVYVRSFHSVNFRLYFQFGVNARRKS